MRRRLILVTVAIYATVLVGTPMAALLWGALRAGPAALASALAKPDVIEACLRTLWIAAAVAAIHGLFGTAAAWALARHRFPGRAALRALVDLPFALSPVVAGYAILLLFGRRGLFAALPQAAGLQVVFALPGVVLATAFVTLPFVVRELIPAIEELPVDEEHAAATLGASAWQTFRRVVLPALRPALVVGVALTFARALGEFGAALVVGGGIQGSTETATVLIYRALEERDEVTAYGVALLLGAASAALVLGAAGLKGQRTLPEPDERA